MEIRKRKLHHRVVKSRALLNTSLYPRTGQSPRVELGDKPAIYDEPVLKFDLVYGPQPSVDSECSIREEQTGYKAHLIEEMADLIRRNLKGAKDLKDERAESPTDLYN